MPSNAVDADLLNLIEMLSPIKMPNSDFILYYFIISGWTKMLMPQECQLRAGKVNVLGQ